MLFSEPKIPQCNSRKQFGAGRSRFQCSSASRKFLNWEGQPQIAETITAFQCSSASRKFLNIVPRYANEHRPRRFSALQRAENSSMVARQRERGKVARFSALQRAENSSIKRRNADDGRVGAFQCSSASRKFLNLVVHTGNGLMPMCFSALQRAENSSIGSVPPGFAPIGTFQCSSASRKFLNRTNVATRRSSIPFQCSSASRKFLNTASTCYGWVVGVRFSALQRAENSSIGADILAFAQRTCFSALQRAENSSIDDAALSTALIEQFQCSSASRKFLNAQLDAVLLRVVTVSVLFSEPKIPQFNHSAPVASTSAAMFQCSSASRKFLNPDPRTCVHPYFRPR